MLDKIKAGWLYVQDFLDLKGGAVMGVMSSVFIARVALSAFGKPAITAAEAAFYSSAIASLAYSNGNPKP
jgi:hypothetical protein